MLVAQVVVGVSKNVNSLANSTIWAYELVNPLENWSIRANLCIRVVLSRAIYDFLTAHFGLGRGAGNTTDPPNL